VGLEPIEYRGELVALVGVERFHLISLRLLECPPDDPDLRFVAFMCVYRREAAEHGVSGYTAGDALKRRARQTLVDERELRTDAHLSDSELARRLNVPRDQSCRCARRVR